MRIGCGAYRTGADASEADANAGAAIIVECVVHSSISYQLYFDAQLELRDAQ
jgi:hypothetical protein